MSRPNCKKLTSLLSMSKQFWALLGLLLICAQLNEAQFFTKSSKSIPRMGRRSDSSMEQSFNRVPLIDVLLDEYGPDLTANILGKHLDEKRVSLPISGEVAYNNEQPIDWNGQSIDNENELSVSRNERSQATKSNKPSNHDASLAMRAFNTNRLLQYLSSGQPLASYERLLTTQKYQDSTKGENQRRVVNDKK